MDIFPSWLLIKFALILPVKHPWHPLRLNLLDWYTDRSKMCSEIPLLEVLCCMFDCVFWFVLLLLFMKGL